MKKICTVCKELRLLEEYHKNPRTKDGRGSQCKLCDAQEAQRICTEKKIYLINLLGGKCSKCGYDKNYGALDFHHLDENKEFVVSKKLRYKIETLVKEAEKCCILCANCHRELHNPKWDKVDVKNTTWRGRKFSYTVNGTNKIIKRN